jgi:hypothetical protein
VLGVNFLDVSSFQVFTPFYGLWRLLRFEFKKVRSLVSDSFSGFLEMFARVTNEGYFEYLISVVFYYSVVSTLFEFCFIIGCFLKFIF